MSQLGLLTGDTISGWPWGALEPFAYDLVMIDPPWRFELYSGKGEAKSAQAQYTTMSLDEIGRLRVAELLKADAIVWLWATAPMLGAQIEMLARWGLRYVTSGVWVKTTRTGKTAFGTGYVLRGAHEPFLIGALGAPRTARDVRSVVSGPVREHSRKPDESYAAAERMMPWPGVRRADVFSRQHRPGWEAWGNEVGKFMGSTEVLT